MTNRQSLYHIMNTATFLALILALIWGAIWALFLQTYHGRFLAARLTWLSVVIGIGVDLLILLLVVPLAEWLIVGGVIAASSLSIIARSLINESHDQRALLRMQRHERT